MQFVKQHSVMLAFVLAIAGFSYLVYAKVAEESAAPGRFGGFDASPLVGVTPVTEMIIADAVEAVGTTLANESLDVTAAVSETVSRVNFEDGDYVEEGRILIELTSTAEASRLSEAQANVDEARRQLDRIQDLAAQRLVAGSELDTARTALDTAQARLEGVMVDMEDRLVRAPFSGYLGFRNVSEGSLLTPGTVITTLDDVSVMKLDFRIPEVYLADVQQGQMLAAKSVVYPDLQFEGEITVVGSRIDPVTRSVSVRAQFDNTDRLLRPGMMMTVRLGLNEQISLVVPERAVIASQGVQHVFVVGAENRISRRQVELGRRRGGSVEIRSGLELGERVVSEGTIRVRPGMTVRIQADAIATGTSSRPVQARVNNATS